MITKDQFLKAYNERKAGRFESFVFENFTLHTLVASGNMGDVLRSILIILFVVCFGATVMSLEVVSMITGFLFLVILVSVVITMIVCRKIANRRIERIAKHLGITVWEYNKLAIKYLK